MALRERAQRAPAFEASAIACEVKFRGDRSPAPTLRVGPIPERTIKTFNKMRPFH
jgi:hypothetical protein